LSFGLLSLGLLSLGLLSLGLLSLGLLSLGLMAHPPYRARMVTSDFGRLALGILSQMQPIATSMRRPRAIIG
jgi:hypothetical protein